MYYLNDLINDAGVQVAGNEPSANPLDLVGTRCTPRDDWGLCWLYCYNLHLYTALVKETCSNGQGSLQLLHQSWNMCASRLCAGSAS